jgi:hypothetical protein
MAAYGGKLIVAADGLAADHPEHYVNLEATLCAQRDDYFPVVGSALPGGVRLVTWTHTGCHQLNRVLTHNNNVVKSATNPTPRTSTRTPTTRTRTTAPWGPRSGNRPAAR